jgi:predicted esterase
MGTQTSKPNAFPGFDQSFTNEAFLQALQEFHVDHLKEHQMQCNCNIIQRFISISQDFSSNNDSEIADKLPLQFQQMMKVNNENRTYLLHIPKNLGSASTGEIATKGLQLNSSHGGGDCKQDSVPLVILLHGTDETMFDTELVIQEKTDSTSWLDLSDREGFVLAIPQARGTWSPEGAKHTNSWRNSSDPFRSLWLCSFVDRARVDHLFLQEMIREIKREVSVLDLKRIYVVGFSNGGFMCSDVALEWKKQRYEFQAAACCPYMGGIEDLQMEFSADMKKESAPTLEQTKDLAQWHSEDRADHISFGPSKALGGEQNSFPRVLAVTGELDCQLFSTLNAWMVFSSLVYHCELDMLKEVDHQYLGSWTEIIWNFFNRK